MTSMALVHGGLWDGMDADRFWHAPGIAPALRARGFTVHTPDRLARPPSWAAEADHLASKVPNERCIVVAASNGCTAAVRLTLAHPDRVERLLLGWPATANDPAADDRTRAALIEGGAAAATIATLLTGQTLRGTDDTEVAGISVPVGLLPSRPDNVIHQRQTVDALRDLLPASVELPGAPEPPNPAFPEHLEAVVDSIAGFAVG